MLNSSTWGQQLTFARHVSYGNKGHLFWRQARHKGSSTSTFDRSSGSELSGILPSKWVTPWKTSLYDAVDIRRFSCTNYAVGKVVGGASWRQPLMDKCWAFRPVRYPYRVGCIKSPTGTGQREDRRYEKDYQNRNDKENNQNHDAAPISAQKGFLCKLTHTEFIFSLL